MNNKLKLAGLLLTVVTGVVAIVTTVIEDKKLEATVDERIDAKMKEYDTTTEEES